QDMGAEGMTSSASEMACKVATGIETNLDIAPQREADMSEYEIMLSETQERMLPVVKKGREQVIIDTFKKHDSEAAMIGTVIEEKRFRLTHGGQVVADVPVDALAEEAQVYNMPAQEATY